MALKTNDNNNAVRGESGRTYDKNHHNAMYHRGRVGKFTFKNKHPIFLSFLSFSSKIRGFPLTVCPQSRRRLHKRAHGILYPPRHLRSRRPIRPARSLPRSAPSRGPGVTISCTGSAPTAPAAPGRPAIFGGGLDG